MGDDAVGLRRNRLPDAAEAPSELNLLGAGRLTSVGPRSAKRSGSGATCRTAFAYFRLDDGRRFGPAMLPPKPDRRQLTNLASVRLVELRGVGKATQIND